MPAGGVTVPYPVEFTGDGTVMQFLGDDGVAAPRLARQGVACDPGATFAALLAEVWRATGPWFPIRRRGKRAEQMAATDLCPTAGGADARARAALADRSPGARVFTVMAVAYVTITVVLVAVGLVLERFGGDSWFGDADQGLTAWLADNRFGVGDTLATTFSQLADPFTVIGVCFGALVVLLVLRAWRQAVVLLVALPLELAGFLSAGFLVRRPRPDVEPLEAEWFGSSFPSGHVAAAIALYGGLAVIVRSTSTSDRVDRGAAVVATVIAVGVGASRVYEGVHHTSDVVAGVGLGIAALATGVVAARTVDDDT